MHILKVGHIHLHRLIVLVHDRVLDDFSTQFNTSAHSECVRKTLVRYRKMQLAFNPDNTFLGVHKGVLVGYVLNENGREPDLDKIAVIDWLHTPINAKGIAKLLGHVGWYRELIASFS